MPATKRDTVRVEKFGANPQKKVPVVKMMIA
jgi:hypothetical protein